MKTENLAILMTDIVGFTEATAHLSRKENEQLLATHNQILFPVIRHFGGRVIKEIGDALLIVFTSPTDAMLCAMAMQDSLFGYNHNRPEEKRIRIRVAASLGEVRVANKDIFGEPVNMTSRIEGITPQDEIYLSDAVYMAMNKAEVPCTEVGVRKLKGISEPVRIWQIPRFSRPRLVPEDVMKSEDIGDFAFPYGGAHLTTRASEHRGLGGLLATMPRAVILWGMIGLLVSTLLVALVYQGLRSKAPAPSPPPEATGETASAGKQPGPSITDQIVSEPPPVKPPTAPEASPGRVKTVETPLESEKTVTKSPAVPAPAPKEPALPVAAPTPPTPKPTPKPVSIAAKAPQPPAPTPAVSPAPTTAAPKQPAVPPTTSVAKSTAPTAKPTAPAAKPAPKPTLNPVIERLAQALQSTNPNIQRDAAKTIYRSHGRDPLLLEEVNRQLLKGYNQKPEDKYHADAMAWMCNVLGASRDSRYRDTLDKVARETRSTKIKRYAIKNQQLLK